MATHPRLAAVALPLALTFACTTVRAPASAIEPTTRVHGDVAEPQVELWIEDSGEVQPDVLARAGAEAHSALRDAVADRHAPGGDAILVVRAQAVSRTAGRRADQKAAVAGMVVGAVVVAAVIVIALASGKGHGGPPRGIGPGRATGGAPVRAPRAFPVPATPVHPRAVHVAGPRVTGAFAVVVGPIDPGPAFVDALVQPPEAPAPPPAGAEAGPAGVLAVTLPPPPPLDLADRGYFAKDLLRLELLLVEPRDGTVRARKTVTREVDVRDGKAVRDLLTAALDDPTGWAPPAPPAVAAAL